MFVILRSRLEQTSHPRSSSSKLPPSLQSAPLGARRKHGSVKSLEKTGKNTFFFRTHCTANVSGGSLRICYGVLVQPIRPPSLRSFVRPALTGDVWQLTGGGRGGERRRRIQHTGLSRRRRRPLSSLYLQPLFLSFSLSSASPHTLLRTDGGNVHLSFSSYPTAASRRPRPPRTRTPPPSSSSSVSAAKAGASASAATHRKVVPSPFRRPE